MHCFLLLLHEGSPSFLFLSLGDVLTEACSETSSTKEFNNMEIFSKGN